MSPWRRGGVIFAGLIPVAFDAEVFNRAAHVGDALGIDVIFLGVSTFVFGEVLVARIVGQIDCKARAPPRRAIADPACVNQDYPGLRRQFS